MSDIYTRSWLDPYWRNRRWWDERKTEFPYQVRTHTSVHPPAIKEAEFGPHASTVLELGVRLWGFKTEAALEAFVAAFGAQVVK